MEESHADTYHVRLLSIIESGNVIRLQGFGSNDSIAQEYVDRITEMGEPDFVNEHGFIIGDVLIELARKSPVAVTINNIRTLDSRGQGKARAALKLLIGLADEMGVTLELYATNYSGRGLDVGDLVAWYERHGFVANSRYHGDGRGVDMVRQPQ